MTVKSFTESNDLTVDKVLNLCQKLGIDVENESDNLSVDDQMLLEYELEELEKSNSGSNAVESVGVGGVNSSTVKKSSSASSDGSDFNIDNETFAAAYKCLVNAVNMLENGLGDLSGLNQNGLGLINASDATATMYNENLTSINEMSSGLQNQMTNTIIMLSRMNYENANYFKDTLGDLLKEGKNEYWDYKFSAEYRDSLIPEWLTDEVDEFFKLVNGGTYNYEDELGMVVKDSVGYAHMNIDEMKQKAEELGISDVKVVSDFITKMDGYNQFFDYATSVENQVISGYGFSMSNKDGLIEKASSLDLLNDSTIKNFIKQSDINNKKIEKEEEKLENSGFSREDYAFRNNVAIEKKYDNYWEYIDAMQSDEEEQISKVSQYSEEMLALQTNPVIMTQMAIDKLKEIERIEQSNPDFTLGSLKRDLNDLVLGYVYELKIGDDTVKHFAESLESIPEGSRDSAQKYTFGQVKETDKGNELFNQVNTIYSDRSDFITTDYSSVSNAISRNVERVNNRLNTVSSNYNDAFSTYESIMEEKNYLDSLDSSLGAYNYSIELNDPDFEMNSIFSEDDKVSAVATLDDAVKNTNNIKVNEMGQYVVVLDKEAYSALCRLHANGEDNEYRIQGNYLVTPDGFVEFETADGYDLKSYYRTLEVAKTGDSGLFKLSSFSGMDVDVVSQGVQNFKNRVNSIIPDYAYIDTSINSPKVNYVIATDEEAKYIYNSIVNGSNDFFVRGDKVWFYDSNGVMTYVYSKDNRLKGAINELNVAKSNPVNINTSSVSNSEMWTKYVTDTDFSAYINYIYNTSDVENKTANVIDYINKSSSVMDNRWVTKHTEIDTDFANRYSSLASIGSVVLAIPEGLKTFSYATEHLGSDQPVFRSAIYSTGDTMRGQVSTNIRASGTETAEIDGFMYDVGMSMLDNTFTSALLTPYGVGIGLALGSFDNSYNDAISRGIGPDKAFAYSMLLSVLEGATEQMSFDHLMKVTKGVGKLSSLFTGVNKFADIPADGVVDEAFDKLIKSYVSNFAGNNVSTYAAIKGLYAIGSQGVSEGVEEYVSSVGGRIIDNYLNKELSANNLALVDYINQGYTNEQALEMVLSSNNEEDFMSFLSGLVSGVGMAGPRYVKNNIGQNVQLMNTLELAEYNGDYTPVVDYLLNLQDYPLNFRISASMVNIDSLYTTGKIDLESKGKLYAMSIDYYSNNYSSSNHELVDELNKEIEFYNVALTSVMKSRLESKGVKTDNLSIEEMKNEYTDDYNEVVGIFKKQEQVIDDKINAVLSNLIRDDKVNDGNFKPENIELFTSEYKKLIGEYSDKKERTSQLIYDIVNSKMFGDDSEKVALKLMDIQLGFEISSDRAALSSLISGIGIAGITQENLLVYMNHQDLRVEDIIKDDSLDSLSEQDRNARLAQILKNYLDQMVNTTKEQNNLSSEQQLRQEHISKDMENNEDKKSIRKDSTSDEKAAIIGKGKNEGSGNDTDLKGNNNSEVVVEENKTDGNEKTSTIEISSNESIKKGQNCIRNLFSPKNSDNSVKTNRLRKKLIKQVVSAYKNIDSRLARDLLRRIDMSKSEGGTGGICGYYEVAKVIFRIFDGKEKLFKQKFGFSMYLNGDFNFEQLIVDLFVNNNNDKYVEELLGGKDVKYKALCDAVTAGKCFNLERICDYLKTKEIDISPSQFKEHQIYNSSNTDFKKMSSDDAKKVAIEIVSNVREQIKSGNQITISAMGIHSGKLEVASGKVVSNVNSIQLINVKTGESRSFSEGHVMSVRGIDSSGRLIVYTFNDLYAINLFDVLSKGNVFSINSLEIGQNILYGESVVDQKVSVEMDIDSSLIIDDDAVMSNGDEDVVDDFIELDSYYVTQRLLFIEDSVNELFNSINESRYYNSQYKKEEVLFGLVKAFKRDSSYAETFSERHECSRSFYNRYLANRNNLNSNQEILEFVKKYVQENTKPGSKINLSQFSLFDILSPRNSNLYGVRTIRHNLIEKLSSKFEDVTQRFMYRILSNIESGIVLDSKYSMITEYIFNKYDGNSRQFELDFGFPMYVDGGFNKTMLIVDIYSYMLSSQYEGKSIREIFSILMDSRGKLHVVDELISNYLVDRKVIDKKQDFVYSLVFDSKTDFPDISKVNDIVGNITSKVSDSLSNGRKVMLSLDSTEYMYENTLKLRDINGKLVSSLYNGDSINVVDVLNGNILVVENSSGRYYIDLRDALINGKKFKINEIDLGLVKLEDRDIQKLRLNNQADVNNKKMTIDEFNKEFNDKDFNSGEFIIKGYEILDFVSDERYMDRLSKSSSNGIVYADYTAKDMIFGLVKLFQELDKNGLSAGKLYPHTGKLYNEYKYFARKGLLNNDDDIKEFAFYCTSGISQGRNYINNSKTKVVGMEELVTEIKFGDDFYTEDVVLTEEATEKLDKIMRNNGSFGDVFKVLKNAIISKDFDSIPKSLKKQIDGLYYSQIKTYLRNKMFDIIKDDIENFDLRSFFYSKKVYGDEGAYVVITDNNMIMVPSKHDGISYTLGDIFEYLDQDFDSSKYTNEAMMRSDSGHIVIELQNKSIGGRNIIYAPNVISGNQYRMLQEFNQQIKELTSKDNLASLGFNLRDNNGSSLELINVNNIDGIASKLLKRVESFEKQEIREEMDKQQEIVEDISNENETKVEEYNDAVMSNGEEDIDDCYELKDRESLRDIVGLQYFGGKNGSNTKSMNSIFGIMNKFFNKANADLSEMSSYEEIISKLFNIEDIRNNNNVVGIDNIKQFESMSVDELNSILMSKRYNLSQKKAVSLVLYLKSLNLGFKTDNIDFVYNSLVYKLSDKSLSSVDKLRVFELLRTISNEFSEFDSVDELLDYQFGIPSESEILDVKTRNSKFDLNEFYSSNEFGHDNGAVIRFTDNQVVSVLNGNNGRGGHGFANENIISAIFGINYVYQSKNFIDPFALSSSFLSSNSRNMIDVRLVSEYGYSLYVVDFPDKISRKQFELFKAYADKYGDTLRRISEDLTANNKTNGYDGLIGFIDKQNNVDVSTHDINDLVKYAETLVDDDFRLLEDRNIVGYTLDDLRGVNVSDDVQIDEEYDDAVMSNGEEDVDDYRKVDVSSYVDIGIYNGTLVPFDAIKFGRIIARRGILGEEIITWSEDSNGNPIQEKPGIVGVDSETGEVDWIVTKVDENGNPIVDKNGHINEWIITDKNFKKKYEIDPKNNSVYRPIGGIQTFVKIDENIILNQWGSDMKIAKGGYINITNEDDMYGISERDFVDTYKVPDIEDYDDYSTSNEDDYKYQDDSDYEDEIYFQLEDKLYEHFHNGKFKINALGNSSNNIDLYSFNVETLVNILKNCYDDFINGTLDLGNVSYNAYRAAFYKLYEILESSDLSDNLLSSIAFDRLRSIAFDYEDDRARMIEEVSNINGSLTIEDYDSVILDNGIECLSDSSSSNLIDSIQRILNSVPSKLRNATKKIVLNSNNNPGESYWKFINGTDSAVDSSQTYSDEIILYKDQIDTISSDGDERIIYRELAYNFDSSMGIISNSEEWINAMKLDGNYVSDYSSNDLREDFANAISNYLLDKDSFSSEYPNRTKIIEQLLNDDSIGYNGENINVNKRRSFVYKLKSKYSKLLLHLNKDIRFNEDRGIDESIKTINGYKVFSKDFDTSIKQMSKYFGDAGISDRQFGRIINMYFIRGMTVSEIKDVLNDEQLKLFNEFLETDNGKYLSKLTSDEIMAIVMYTRTGDRAINKSLRTGNYTGTFSYTDEYTGKTKTITIEKFISDLNSALEKFGGIKEDTVIYRAVKLTTFTRYNSIFTRLFESIKNVDDCVEIYSVMRNLVGERFSDLGFMSASPAYNTSYAMYDGFPVVLEILTPKGTPGAYINQISKDYNRENEFLYMNDTSLTILDVQLLHNYGDVNGVDKVVVRCIVDNKTDINEDYDDAVMSNGEEDYGYELEDSESDSRYSFIDKFVGNFDINSFNNENHNQFIKEFIDSGLTLEELFKVNLIREYYDKVGFNMFFDNVDNSLILDILLNNDNYDFVISKVDSYLKFITDLIFKSLIEDVNLKNKTNLLLTNMTNISFMKVIGQFNLSLVDNPRFDDYKFDFIDYSKVDIENIIFDSFSNDVIIKLFNNRINSIFSFSLLSRLSDERVLELLSNNDLDVSAKAYLVKNWSFSKVTSLVLDGKIELGINDIVLENGRTLSAKDIFRNFYSYNFSIFVGDIRRGIESRNGISIRDKLFSIIKLFEEFRKLGYKFNFENSDYYLSKFYNKYNRQMKFDNDRFIYNFVDQVLLDRKGYKIKLNSDSIIDQGSIRKMFVPIYDKLYSSDKLSNYYNEISDVVDRKFIKENPSVVPKRMKLKYDMIDLVKNKFPSISDKMAIKFLKSIDSSREIGGTGGICNYADIARFIFDRFRGKEELFEKQFGFPMYIDGKLNQEQLLCDMFISISGDVLIKRKDGVKGFFGRIVNDNYELVDNMYNNLCNSVGDLYSYNLNFISKYLLDKGIINDRSELKQDNIFTNTVDSDVEVITSKFEVNRLIIDVYNAIKSGHHVSISSWVSSDDGVMMELFDIDGNVKNVVQGAHIMSVVGIDSNGRLIVETWGNNYYINLEDSISSGCLFTIDSIYIQSVDAQNAFKRNIRLSDSDVKDNSFVNQYFHKPVIKGNSDFEFMSNGEEDLDYYDDSMFFEDDAVMSNGEDSVNLDIFDGLSEKMIEGASRLFNKSVSDLTVEELERYQTVVKTADEILRAVPNGFFKDDIQRDEFLYGVPGDVATGSKFSAFDLRTKFLDAINNGSLVKVIDTFTKGELDSLKVAGFHKIIYAINQFVEENGIIVEDGVLPIKQIAAKDPAYFEGGKDLVLSVLADNLKQAEDNRDRITGVLSEIAALNNGTLRGLDKSLKSEDSASRKVYNSWLEALEDAGYAIESGNNVIDENGNIRLIGIKEFNKGQSFVLTSDGTIFTSDLKNYGVDKKGNVVNISFSDFIPKDLLRYTIISNSGSYMDTLLNTIRLLEENGYEIISSNLSWPGSFYKGVNLTLREKNTSQIFELQFHTETSFYAKNEGTHDFYEVKRNKLYNDGEKSSSIQRVADYAQILVESNVEVPNGAEKLGVINKFVKYVLTSDKNIDLTKMNEIIAKVKEINSMYDSNTDAYKDAMKALINSVSIQGEFSFGEFLSEYFKIDTVSGIDGKTEVVSSEIVSDTGDSSWVEDEDFGIEEEDSDGYKLKDGERLGGRIGMQFFGGTLNNNDSQLPLFSKLIESIGNNDLFQQVLEQIKNLKETDLIGFKTLDEYKEYIIDYFISINFDGLTPRQFWLLTTDKFMLKKLIGTEVLNKFILDYYERAYVNLAETFNLLDAKSINQIFNNPVIKDYIMGLSADVFTKSINAFCEYSNYTWLQCDTFVEKIMDMSYDELYIFMEKTNWKKEKLIKMVFDSRDYESCLKLLHFIENKCLNVEVLLEHPEYRLLISDFYPYVYGNEELLRMNNKQKHIKDEFESKIISLLNENLDDVLLSDGYRIANLDTHSVYVVKYELNGNIMQWEILTENKNYINMRYAIDKNDIYKAIVSKNFKLLSIQKDEFASKLCLSSENGLVEGINKLRLKINGIEKQILVNYSGYGDINLSDRFGSVSSIEIIDVKSVESKNVILDDGIGIYEITYIENGTLNKTYLTPTHKSLWDEDYVLKIDDYFIENNIVNATDIQIRKVDMQEIDFSSLDISKYSSSYEIFTNNKYGGNQSDVRKLVIDFINGTEMNFVSSEKAKTMLNLIDKYFPNSSDIDKVNLVVAFEQVGCGYIAVANAFCTYMGSLENGFEIFKEKLGFDLYILENGKKYYNVEAVAFDILCSQFIVQDIKSIINENKIEGVNGLNFVVMMKNYFNDKSIFVKASTGNYIKNKNETKINLLSGNFFPSKSSFKILSASNFDMELMSLRDNSFTSNDGSLNNTEIVGKVIEGIGGHAMIVTGVGSDGELIVSSWNKKYKFISESIDKYIRQGQKSEASVWTIEFDIGE